jgi:hypothetical protein
MSGRFRCERCGRSYAVSEAAPVAGRAPGRGEPLPPLGKLAGAAPGAEVRPRRRRGTGRALALAVALGAAGIAAGLLLLRGRPAPVAAPAAEPGPRQVSASPGGAVRTASRARP